jgi:hypothetical protein
LRSLLRQIVDILEFTANALPVGDISGRDGGGIERKPPIRSGTDPFAADWPGPGCWNVASHMGGDLIPKPSFRYDLTHGSLLSDLKAKRRAILSPYDPRNLMRW